MTLYIDNRTTFEWDEKWEKIVQKAVRTSLDYEEFESECEISISIVTNNEIQKLNKEFRNIDKETDVLSFPQLTFEEGEIADINENDEIILFLLIRQNNSQKNMDILCKEKLPF